MAESEIETPCVNVCRIDPATELCAGCRRSRAEIAAWRDLSPEERRHIMARLPARPAISTLEPL